MEKYFSGNPIHGIVRVRLSKIHDETGRVHRAVGPGIAVSVEAPQGRQVSADSSEEVDQDAIGALACTGPF